MTTGSDSPTASGSLTASGSPTRAGDSLFLRGLSIECIIGFIEWERHVKQAVVIDLELPLDCRRAAITDEVADTLDYKRLAKRVIAFVEASQFKLVETLAHRTALVVLDEFDVEWVRLTLNKPGAIRSSRDVGVTIERTRADLAGLDERGNRRDFGELDRRGELSGGPGGVAAKAQGPG